MDYTPRFTYIGGPTALLEWHGLRFLTDPTFDPAGTNYKSGPATLRKLAGPAISAGSLGAIDIVLLITRTTLIMPVVHCLREPTK